MFEAGGNRPQPQGLRASKSRKALMLGIKTGGVPLGFKRCKRFLWFLSTSTVNPANVLQISIELALREQLNARSVRRRVKILFMI